MMGDASCVLSAACHGTVVTQITKNSSQLQKHATAAGTLIYKVLAYASMAPISRILQQIRCEPAGSFFTTFLLADVYTFQED
jgi:hypothetical protein